MRRLRLLYCIDTVGQDAGPDRQLSELIPRIDPLRFEIHLCCFEQCERLNELSRWCAPLVLPVPSFYRPRGLRALSRLHRYIDEHRIEVMHTFMVDANILGILAARRSYCRAVISSRRNMGYWMTPLYRRLYRLLNRFSTRLLANSEAVRRHVIATEGVAPEKVDVLYNGVDLARFARGAGDPPIARSRHLAEGAKVVGVVANLRPIKDHALFLKAAKQVAEAVPEATFLLVGTGPLRRSLAALAEELGIGRRVLFSEGTGTVVDYLPWMDVGCLSSASEGFSNALLEYMAAGLPVVATDVGGNREAVEHGVTGFIVPHGNPSALAAPIIELLANESLRQRLGRRSRQRCSERFAIEDVVRRHENYYAAVFEQVALRPAVRGMDP
ncbi:MAG: glycosyltransferase [Candidatus Eisenbacteria sp.]|nr:glycosyltransferase [Candidatus Eisenbacteria bacterium]